MLEVFKGSADRLSEFIDNLELSLSDFVGSLVYIDTISTDDRLEWLHAYNSKFDVIFTFQSNGKYTIIKRHGDKNKVIRTIIYLKSIDWGEWT